jgi:predicted aspartyl protease
MGKLGLVVGASLLALSSVAVSQSATQAEPASGQQLIDSETQTQEIKFRSDGAERMTVPVTLGGNGPFRFMVDTGANRTVVSRQVASRLKLGDGPSASMHSVTGVSAVATTDLPQIRFSERRVDNVRALVLDADHVGADGVLGTDSLSSQRILFDFKHNLLSITPTQKRATADEAGTIIVRARARQGRLLVTDAYANGRKLTVIVDTGSQFSIGNAALRRALIGTRAAAPKNNVEILSVTGETLQGEIGRVNKLTIGDEITLEHMSMVFADAHTFKQLGLEKKPAILLGMNALRAFDKVSIDFAARRIRVLMPEGTELQDKEQLAGRAARRRPRAG